MGKPKILELEENVTELENNMEPKILWQGDIGAVGNTITLNDNINNYKYIDVLGKKTIGTKTIYCSERIQGNCIASIEARFFNSVMYFYDCTFEVSGTILKIIGGAGHTHNNDYVTTGSFTGNCQMSIVKVIGYK